MEIGSNSHIGVRHAGVPLGRATRKDRAHNGVVGRDFSVDGSNAP
jgi:hypothetical protein